MLSGSDTLNGHLQDLEESSKEPRDIQACQDYYKANGRFPLFQSVSIETRTDCNRRCTFCPQADHQRDFIEMEWPVFERIIANLAEIGYAGRIALFITNEPLLDPRLVDMIRYAKRVSPAFELDINTNGNLLTLQKVEELLSAGLDKIKVEDYRADRENFPEKLSKNLEEIARVYAGHPNISIHARSTKETLSNRGGHVENGRQNLFRHSFCSYPFRKMNISPNGDVVLCCMDYLYEAKFGNVMERRLEEIWNSEALNQRRFMLMAKNRKGLCAGCDFSEYPVVARDISRSVATAEAEVPDPLAILELGISAHQMSVDEKYFQPQEILLWGMYIQILDKLLEGCRTVLAVGDSDGRLLIPVARRHGIQLTIVDPFLGENERNWDRLWDNLRLFEYGHNCRIQRESFQEFQPDREYDGVISMGRGLDCGPTPEGEAQTRGLLEKAYRAAGRVMAVELGKPVEGNGFETIETLQNTYISWGLMEKAPPAKAPPPDPGKAYLPLGAPG